MNLKRLKDVYQMVRYFFSCNPFLVTIILNFVTVNALLILFQTPSNCFPLFNDPNKIVSTFRQCQSIECFGNISLYNKYFGVSLDKNEHMLSYYHILNCKVNEYCYFSNLKQQVYGCPDLLKFNKLSLQIAESKPKLIEFVNISASKTQAIKHPYSVGGKFDHKITRFNLNNSIITPFDYTLYMQINSNQTKIINDSKFVGLTHKVITYEEFKNFISGLDDKEIITKFEEHAEKHETYREIIGSVLNNKREK
jgi:hypothetical protein